MIEQYHYEPVIFKDKKIFEECIQDFILDILKDSFDMMIRDTNIIIDKHDELKCTLQLVYFAIKLRARSLFPFIFETETPINLLEEYVYGHKSPKCAPRIDIKVKKPDWDEHSFLTIECKRINNDSILRRLYVNEGMERFISCKYCPNNNCSIMVGFIIDGEMSEIISELNNYIKRKYTDNDLLQYFKDNVFYVSNHIRSGCYSPFRINHFFADLNKNLT